MRNKPKQIIGVELGSACLKAAVIEFNERSKTLLMREYAIQPVEDAQHDLLTSVGLLLGKLKTSCRDCAITGWPDSSLLRFFEHDTETTSNIRQVLDASQEGLDGFILDFVDTGEGTQSPKSRLYLACGLPRKEMEATRDPFQQLKYNILLFQLSPIAVFNAFQASLEEHKLEKPFLSIDFGRKRSSLSGGGNGALHLMREIPWGADDLQRFLEEQKVISKGQSLRDLAAPPDLEAIQEAIAPLVRQIAASRDYVRNQVDSGYLSEIHISGGLSSFEAFTGILQRELESPCVKWNPFRNMQASTKALSDTSLLSDLFRLQAAAGAAIQFLS